MEPCTVQTVKERVTGDLMTNLLNYEAAFRECALKIRKIREWDAEARREAQRAIAASKQLPP